MLFRLCIVFSIVVGCCHVGGTELRVLTYNIHHGRGADGAVDLQRIAEVIRSAELDLVALNEVDKGVNRSGRVDQPAELARLCNLVAAFEKNIDHDGGEYGNAILSRWPIQETENVQLPSLYEGEQRGMMVAQVEPRSGMQLHFAVTHLDYRPDDTERLQSADYIEDYVTRQTADRRFILAGDLNAEPTSEVLSRFKQSWSIADSGDTFPAASPSKRIDYVLFRPSRRWRVVSSEVLKAPQASDHRPLLVVFEMQE